jgi:hypothetical protein
MSTVRTSYLPIDHNPSHPLGLRVHQNILHFPNEHTASHCLRCVHHGLRELQRVHLSITSITQRKRNELKLHGGSVYVCVCAGGWVCVCVCVQIQTCAVSSSICSVVPPLIQLGCRESFDKLLDYETAVSYSLIQERLASRTFFPMFALRVVIVRYDFSPNSSANSLFLLVRPTLR